MDTANRIMPPMQDSTEVDFQCKTEPGNNSDRRSNTDLLYHRNGHPAPALDLKTPMEYLRENSIAEPPQPHYLTVVNPDKTKPICILKKQRA